MENKMKGEMGKQTQDAPFKGPVRVASFAAVNLVGYYCYDGDGRKFTLDYFGDEGQKKCLAIAAAINTYNPERDAAWGRAVAALKYSRLIVARWCHYQGDSKQFHNETLEPIDAAIAEYEVSK